MLRAFLRQCKWNCTDSKKKQQIKRASDKVRFDGGINLLFHFGVVLVRILIFWELIFCNRDTVFSQAHASNVNTFFK